MTQFRTVIKGYRLHGTQFSSIQSNEVFYLKITSSSNKQEAYVIIFNSQMIEKINLKNEFQSPKKLYEYLSKSTKYRLKIDGENKKISILIEKDKVIKQFFIDLTYQTQHQIQLFNKLKQQHINQSSQQPEHQILIHENIKQEQQTKVEDKQSQPDFIHISKSVEQKDKAQDTNNLDEIWKKFQQMRRKKQQIENKKKQGKQKRQIKQVSYLFDKQKKSDKTLYEYAFEKNIQVLLDLIETNQFHLTSQLVLKRCRIGIIPPFNQLILENLKILNLQENQIQKIENLDKIPNLQMLNLDGNKIKKIQNLQHLSQLKILRIGNNEIKKIQNLRQLKNLQTVWLDFNQITLIQNLDSLPKLKSLNLSFNSINKIQNLNSLHNLEELLLNQNKISQIQNISHLSKLIRFSLNSNMIKKITGVKKLLLLEGIYLCDNEISDFDRDTFEELNWLKMLKQIKLTGNSIKLNEQSKELIERLRKYGTKVSL